MESSILLLSEGTPNSTIEHSTTMFIPHVMPGQMKNTDSRKYPCTLEQRNYNITAKFMLPKGLRLAGKTVNRIYKSFSFISMFTKFILFPSNRCQQI